MDEFDRCPNVALPKDSIRRVIAPNIILNSLIKSGLSMIVRTIQMDGYASTWENALFEDDYVRLTCFNFSGRHDGKG